MNRRIILIGFGFLTLIACTPNPQRGPLDKAKTTELPPPTPAAPVGEKHARACEGLARAGCAEAHPKTGSCEGDLAQAEGYGETIRFDCYAAALNADAVRACGGVGYFSVRCK